MCDPMLAKVWKYIHIMSHDSLVRIHAQSGLILHCERNLRVSIDAHVVILMFVFTNPLLVHFIEHYSNLNVLF